MSAPEARLWSRLRARRLGGLRFRRQHPIGPYIADFYCHEARLVVEVDGRMHDGVHDARRDAWMRARGVRVVRVSVDRLVRDIDNVLYNISCAADAAMRDGG